MDFLALTSTIATFDLSSVVNADLLNPVMNQIIGVIPVVLGFGVSVAGIRKGLGFVFNAIHAA